MKKGIIIVVAFIGLALNNANAQSKFGHINTSDIIRLMPEMLTVKNKLDTFQLGLKKEYDDEMIRYQELVEEYTKMVKDSVSQGMLESKYKEVAAKEQKLQELPSLLEGEYAEKQQKLMKPLLDKLQLAIKEVAAEKGLNYVFDLAIGSLLYYDPADDMSMEVRKKLGISDKAIPIKLN